MSRQPAIREQMRLIAGLRWCLFRNSLRSLRGRLDVVGYVLLWLMLTGLMFGGGAGIGFGAYAFLSRHQAASFADLFWAVLLFWQLYPLLIGTGGLQFEFGNLLHFPLRYGSFFALSLTYGLLDPGAVIALFWLACLSLGAGLARPGLLAWVVAAALLFAAMNLLLSRAIATWADRWLAQRRTREILGMLFIVGLLTVQFAGPTLARWTARQHAAVRWLVPLANLVHALPPGMAAQAVAGAAAFRPLLALAGLLAVCLYGVGFSWLLHLRLAAQFRGESLSETKAPAPPTTHARAAAASTGWRLPGLSTRTAALFERETRYTLRNWPVLFQLLLPAFFVILLSPSFKHTRFFTSHPEMAFPVAVAYAFFSENYWIFNSFGYDGEGIRFLLLAPLRFRQVMIGKNLLHTVATVLNIALLWACVRWIFRPPGAEIVALTLLVSLYALLVNLAVGNVTSVRLPNRLEFGVFRRGRGARGLAVAIGLGTEAVLVGSGMLIFVLGVWLHGMGLAMLASLGLAGMAAAGYVFSLREVERVILHRREAFTEELCRTSSAS